MKSTLSLIVPTVSGEISIGESSNTVTNMVATYESFGICSPIFGYGAWSYAISCNSNLEYAYNKYDVLNRVIESGEYESNSVSNFTQANADNSTFPSSGTVLNKKFVYDIESSDPEAIGQRYLKGKLSYTYSYRLGDLVSTSIYSYDEYGRVEWVLQKIVGISTKQIKYACDLAGNMLTKSYVDFGASGNNLYTFYEYDEAGRLTNVYTDNNPTGNTKTREANYSYTATGKVKQLKVGAAPAQTLDYTYAERDWLSSISSPTFSMNLGYNTIAEIGQTQGATGQFNGNISWVKYSMSGVNFTGTPIVGWSYSYDKANRLTKGDFGYNSNGWQGTSAYDLNPVSYDQAGNISSLKRYGNNATLMDDLTYIYTASTNKLRHVSDNVTNASLYPNDVDNQQTDNYSYDPNGNVTQDPIRDIGFVIYDPNNLPVSVYRKSSSALYGYYYDSNNQRVRKDASSTEYYIFGAEGKTEAITSNDLTTTKYNVFGNDQIGQLKRQTNIWSHYYHLKDHLGSVRMTMDAGTKNMWEDFNAGISNWVEPNNGTQNFGTSNGELVHNTTGMQYIVNNSTATLGDGVATVSFRLTAPVQPNAGLVLRYSAGYCYIVKIDGYTISIVRRYPWNSETVQATANYYLGTYQNYNLSATLNQGTISVSVNGSQIISWTDPSPLAAGKVGFRDAIWGVFAWDNLMVTMNATASVASSDDYDPFGMVLEGRSISNGSPDTRYKFTGKEKDSESGWDWFNPGRYYDDRIGRWLQVDPMATKLPQYTPYEYSLNNPINVIDSDGKWPFYVHNWMIEAAFRNNPMMSSAISTLKTFSGYADNAAFQSRDLSFLHAMSPFGSKTDEPTIKNINDFMNRTESSELGADADFAIKLHLIMDMTSPAHEGLQKWGMANPRGHAYEELEHFAKEALPIDQGRQRAAIKLIQEFASTYYQKDITKVKKFNYKDWQQQFNRYLFEEEIEEAREHWAKILEERGDIR